MPVLQYYKRLRLETWWQREARLYNNAELAPSSLSVCICPKKAIKCIANLTLSDNTELTLANTKLAMANANEAPVTFTPHLAGVNPPPPLEVNENKVENWNFGSNSGQIIYCCHVWIRWKNATSWQCSKTVWG